MYKCVGLCTLNDVFRLLKWLSFCVMSHFVCFMIHRQAEELKVAAQGEQLLMSMCRWFLSGFS
jgi:hypothetical protein